MNTTLFKSLFTCFALVSLGEIAHAQKREDGNDTLSLRSLLNVKITTASKTSQAAELASAVVTVVTREQIRLRNYQSLLDVMYDLADVKVDDKMYSGMRNSFTIRGTQGSEKFLIMLNGINIASPSGEALPVMQNYPVHHAQQIEILYGPASALYGADAVSGIINIITRKTQGPDLVAEVSTAVGDYGYTNTTFFLSKRIASNGSLSVSGQYFYDRNPDYSKLYKDDSLSSIADYNTGTFNTVFGPFTPSAGVRPAYESPMRAYNVHAALNLGNFTMTIFRNYSRIPTSLGNNTRNAIFNKDVYMGQHVTVANATFKRKLDRFTTSTILTASKYDMDPESNYRNLYSSMEAAYKYSTCTMIRAEEQLDFRASDKLSVTGGVAFENYNSVPQSADLSKPVNKKIALHGNYLGTSAFYKPEGLPAPFYSIQYQNIGTYVQTQYTPASKFHITAGARFDHNSRFGSSFNPRVGLVYQFRNKSTLKVLYGQAFRAPSPAESYAQYGSFETADSGRTYHSHFLHLPNTGLQPVRSKNIEVNYQHHFTDNLVFSVDGYFTVLKGLYAFANDNETTDIYNNQFNGIPVDYVEVFINSDRQKNYGGSVQVRWKKSFRNILTHSFASLSYVNGVKEQGLSERIETTPDVQLDFIAPVMIRVGTDLMAGKFTCSPRLLLMGRQQVSGIADTTKTIDRRQTIAGYSLLNIALRYNASSHVSFFANVTNALNQRYRVVGFNMDLTRTQTELYHGQPQDPIRIMTGVNLNF